MFVIKRQIELLWSICTNWKLQCRKVTLSSWFITCRNCCIFLSVCSDIDRWPAPVPGKVLQLPIMGVIMKVRTPALVFAEGVHLSLYSSSLPCDLFSLSYSSKQGRCWQHSEWRSGRSWLGALIGGRRGGSFIVLRLIFNFSSY